MVTPIDDGLEERVDGLFHEVDKDVLRMWDESVADARFFMSLSAGALLLVAAFLRENPGVIYAAPIVGFALSAFLISLVANFLDLWCGRDAKNVYREGMVAELAVKVLNTSKDEVRAAHKKYKKLEVWANRGGRIGIFLFFVGVISIGVLGFLMVWSWSNGEASPPSSMPHW